jgi:NitT/TauT family transport system substrate-binding protein
MGMEKSKVWIVAVIVVAIVIVSAGITILAQPKSEDPAKIRIGVLPVIDTLPLYVGQERGLFENNGLSIELVSFTSAVERDSAFAAGEIDGYFGDMINTLVLKSTGEDVKVITVDYHTTPGYRMFGLLASPNSGITNISGIAGQEIATSLGSVSEYFVDEILAAHNLSGDVNKFKVPAIPIRYQSLMTDQVKLALLPEPFATQAIKDGAKLIADDSSIDTTATVIAMRGGFVSSHADQVKKFLDTYNKSVSMVNQDPMQFKDILENDIHFPPALENGFVFPPLSEISLPSHNEADRVQSWMIDKGVLKSEISYDDIMAAELYE